MLLVLAGIWCALRKVLQTLPASRRGSRCAPDFWRRDFTRRKVSPRMPMAWDCFPWRRPKEYVDMRRVVECAAIYALTAMNILKELPLSALRGKWDLTVACCVV